MKFNILEAPSLRFRRMNAVPMTCAALVAPFAKPKILSCSYIDIIQQYRISNGIKLRTLIYNVKATTTLLSSVSSSRLAMQYMLSGEMQIQKPGFEKILLNERKYLIRQLDTTDDQITLDPGVYKFISMEISESTLKSRAESSTVIKQLLNQYEDGYTFIYGQDFDLKDFRYLHEDMTNFYLNNQFKEDIFGLRMTECLLRLLMELEAVSV